MSEVLNALRRALRNNDDVVFHDPGETWDGETFDAQMAIREEAPFKIDEFDGVFEYVEGSRMGYEYDTYQVVLSYNNGEQYFAVYGSYSSWEGIDFSYPEVEEVEKKEVTKTEWVKKD